MSIISKLQYSPRAIHPPYIWFLKIDLFKLSLPGGKNCAQIIYPSAGFDGQFFCKGRNRRQRISTRSRKWNVLHLHIKRYDIPVLRWKDLTLLVQISHLSLVTFHLSSTDNGQIPVSCLGRDVEAECWSCWEWSCRHINLRDTIFQSDFQAGEVYQS